MGRVYLFDKFGNRIREFNNVQSWGDNFVEWLNNGYRAKMYCNSEAGEYITDDPSGARPQQPGEGATLDDALAALTEIGIDTAPLEAGTTEGGTQL